MAKVRRDYGPFFSGYVGSRERHLIPLDAVSEDSTDLRLEPLTGKLARRPGSAVVGDTFSALVGLLESKWAAKGRQVVELDSPSLSDGYPTRGVLFTDDTDKEGLFYFRSTNSGGSNQVIGKSFGSTHYPTAASTVSNFKMTPLWTENGTTIFTRCIDATQRKVFCPGSRKTVKVGNWRAFPSRFGTPARWNERFNDATGSGTENERITTTGPIPPLWAPKLGTLPSSSTDGPWLGSDQFYMAVVFQFEDGSYSAPFLPQGKNATLTSGLGLVTVDSVNPTTRYPYIPLADVPVGYEGVIRRIVLRSPKVDSTATPYVAPDPTDLRIWEVINNNTSTTLNSTNGLDSSLVENPQVVRPDMTMPPRARFMTVFDQRVVVGDLANSPVALFLNIYDSNGTVINAEDDSASLFGTVFWHWRLDSTNLTLKHTTGGATTTDHTIALASKTLQDLCDAINATGTYKWRAQVAPGADPQAPCSDLQVTSSADFGDDGIVSDATTGNQRVFGASTPSCLYFKSSSAWLSRGLYPRAVQWTIAGPGQGDTDLDAPAALNAWVGGNQCRRDQKARVGRMVGLGALLSGMVVVYSRAIGVVRNIRGGKTGIDADYRLELMLEGSGGIARGSVVEGNGWVGYLKREGYFINDGEREVCISDAVWNPTGGDDGRGYGPWEYEVGQCIKAMAGGTDDDHFHAFVHGGRLFVRFRSSSDSSTQADRLMVYDFSPNIEQSGLQQVLRPDGKPFGWSAPMRLYGEAMGVVELSDGPHYYSVNEEGSSGYTTGDGRTDEFWTGAYDLTQTVTANVTAGNGSTSLTLNNAAVATQIPPGATITHANIPASTTVVSVTRPADDYIITISQATTGAIAAANATVYGKTVQPTGYCVADYVGDIKRRKRVGRADVMSRKVKTGSSGFTVGLSRTLTRSVTTVATLPVTSSLAVAFDRTIVNPPQSMRSPSDVLEWSFTDDGSGSSPAEMLHIGCEVEILESAT